MESLYKPKTCKNTAAKWHIKGTGKAPYAELAPALSAHQAGLLRCSKMTTQLK